MFQFNPNDPEELAFTLHKAVNQSGLTLAEISERLKKKYGEQLSPSAISHAIWRGSNRFQRALQILAACGETVIEIKTS